MTREEVIVRLRSSAVSDALGLILTVRGITKTDVDVVIGYPGLPNVTAKMQAGDATLFETQSRGLIEARLLSFSFTNDVARFLLTEVSPRVGLIAGAADIDPENDPFTEAQLQQIKESVLQARTNVGQIQALAPEQLQLIHRKLDEIAHAANRMGRKDWVNYAAGSLTSVCIAGAFAPDVTRSIFDAVNTAFAWLFAGGILLLH